MFSSSSACTVITVELVFNRVYRVYKRSPAAFPTRRKSYPRSHLRSVPILGPTPQERVFWETVPSSRKGVGPPPPPPPPPPPAVSQLPPILTCENKRPKV